MKPQLLRVGNRQSPVVVIDDFSGRREAIVEAAAALAPYPEARGTYYPGVRRVIGVQDGAALDYVVGMLEDAAQFIAGAFDADGFDLLEASFSMVTAAPASLSHAQRMPHFDSTDPKYLAVLHYLSDTPGTGTAFYRQRLTGIERVEANTQAAFISTAKLAEAPEGYINGSNAHYEQIGQVEAVPDRLVIYQGSLLHSGIIPSGMSFSSDPRQGRLTANIFVRAH